MATLTSNPFPGMNPYLESPTYWRGFHNFFIAAIADQLNETLPPGFSANAEEWLYLLPFGKPIAPDVFLLQEEERVETDVSSRASSRPIAVTPPFVATLLQDQEESELFVEVTASREEEPVIAVIEVLSPTNKRNIVGRQEYLTKQGSLLRSPTHLLEIDLLLGGEHTVALPREFLEQAAANPQYVASLHHGLPTSQEEYAPSVEHRLEFWPISLREPLPTIEVPLRQTGDASSPLIVPLNLQASFDQAFHFGPYRRRIRYGEPPPMRLSEDDANWIDALLRDKGLRPNITNEEVA